MRLRIARSIENTAALVLLGGVCVSAISVATVANAADDKRDNGTTVSKLWDSGAPLTFAGLTIYGTVDAGVDTVTHGAGISPINNTNQTYIISKNSNGPVSGLVGSPLETSKLGLKGSEPLGGDLSFVLALLRLDIGS